MRPEICQELEKMPGGVVKVLAKHGPEASGQFASFSDRFVDTPNF